MKSRVKITYVVQVFYALVRGSLYFWIELIKGLIIYKWFDVLKRQIIFQGSSERFDEKWKHIQQTKINVPKICSIVYSLIYSLLLGLWIVCIILAFQNTSIMIVNLFLIILSLLILLTQVYGIYIILLFTLDSFLSLSRLFAIAFDLLVREWKLLFMVFTMDVLFIFSFIFQPIIFIFVCPGLYGLIVNQLIRKLKKKVTERYDLC